jgi:hypothetical protein
MFKLGIVCCVLAAPASAAVVTYTYEGPDLTCEDPSLPCDVVNYSVRSF